MRNNIIFVIALAFSLAGCATVQLSQILPDYSKVTMVPASQRANYYQKMKIDEIQGSLARIDGSWYSRDQIRAICNQTKAFDAKLYASRVKSDTKWMDVAVPTVLGGSFLVGFAAGYVGYLVTGHMSPDPNSSSELGVNLNPNVGGNRSLIAYGSAGGLVTGLALFGILHHHHVKNTAKNIGKARELFNKHLWEQLNIDLLPKPGGAAGAIKFTY